MAKSFQSKIPYKKNGKFQLYKKLSSLANTNLGAKFSQHCYILTTPPLTFPAKIADVLLWQINPPTLIPSRPKLANLPTNPKIGRHMCTAPYMHVSLNPIS